MSAAKKNSHQSRSYITGLLPAFVRSLTGKALRPSATEVRRNVRARSARLRAAEKLAGWRN